MGILETICAERREDARAAARRLPATSLERIANPPRRAFRAEGTAAGAATSPGATVADRPSPGPAAPGAGSAGSPFLIAECKRASPSKGLMVADYDPVHLALCYERGGAGLLSVLTEPRHFLGADAHLRAVRGSVELPILRKDFIVDEWQIRESWAIGADAILLIAACLSPAQLAEYVAAARELGLSILVETREPGEIGAALDARPDAVGVNARDLRDFSVSASVPLLMAGELSRAAPRGLPLVAESGLRRGADARALLAASYRGFLVGEALATAPDPEEATRGFLAELLDRGETGRRQ